MLFNETYDCIYKAAGKAGPSLDNLNTSIEVELSHYACFSSVYSSIRSCGYYADVVYELYLYSENIEGHHYNLCTRLETKKILRCLQKTVPFTYKFKKGRYTNGRYSNEEVDFDVLEIHLIGNYAQHLWITSMLRCFFEWPYNIAAKEACNLQSEIKAVDDFDLTKENWINLYLTIAAQLGSYSLHGVVSFNGQHPKAKTYQEWKQKLESMTGYVSVHDRLRSGGGQFNPRTVQRVSISNQAEYDKGTSNRASKYVAAYKDKLSWKK